MGRWSRYTDTDAGHLPHGMEPMGYDADAEVYLYRDKDGSVWASASGNRYGNLSLVTKAPVSRRHTTASTRPSISLPRDNVKHDTKISSPTSPTEFATDKLLHRSKALHPNATPAPPYVNPETRFIDFAQLPDLKDPKKEQEKTGGIEGLLSSMKRGLSVRKPKGVSIPAPQMADQGAIRLDHGPRRDRFQRDGHRYRSGASSRRGTV
jgi:hypothetical protein